MKIRITKQNKYRLQKGVCIQVGNNDFPYGNRLIREGIAEQITERQFAEYVANQKMLKYKQECDDCKKTKKKCKDCE